MHQLYLAPCRSFSRPAAQVVRRFHVHVRQRHEFGEPTGPLLQIANMQEMARPVSGLLNMAEHDRCGRAQPNAACAAHDLQPLLGLFDPETPNFQFVAQVAPRANETVVEKQLPNAFAKTDLDAKIQAVGKRTLVIAGFMTHMCVSATTRSALDHGYTVTVASDAVATRDLPDPLGGPDLLAEQVNRAALAELADRFATVALVAEIKDR